MNNKILYIISAIGIAISMFLLGVSTNPSTNFIQSTHNDIKLIQHDNETHIKNIDRLGRTTGESMRPTIWDGNILLYQKIDDIHDLQPGHIVRIQKKDRSVVHRVRSIYGDYIITQGDNVKIPDKKVEPEKVTHKVVGVIYTENNINVKYK